MSTNSEIIKAIYFKHLKEKETFKAASDAATWCVIGMWTKLDIPIWGHGAVEVRVQKLFVAFQIMLGSDKSRPGFQSKVEQFDVRSSHIFDTFCVMYYVFVKSQKSELNRTFVL